MLLFASVTVICRSDILGMLGYDRTENGDDEEDLEWVLNDLVERVFGDTSNDQFGDHLQLSEVNITESTLTDRLSCSWIFY